MSILDGRWESEADAGDRQIYSNYRSIEDLELLSQDNRFDVIIVGGGGSGAAAAIEAVDRGASVLVLEKTKYPGGSTQESGGTVRLVSDREGTAAHMFALAQGSTPKDVIDVFVEGLAELPEWVKAHQGEFQQSTANEFKSTMQRGVFPTSHPGTAFPTVPFASSLGTRAHMQATRPDRVRGEALWDFLAQNLERFDVPVVLGAAVRKLVQKFPERSVVGVEVATPTGTVTIHATKAVILCCGGFSYDNEMMTQYFGVALPTVSGQRRSTGDGIRMALDVGADLWHMSATSTTIGFRPPELDAGFHFRIADYGFILVDQLTHRYMCETDLEHHGAAFTMMSQDQLTGQYLCIPSYAIFDDVTRRAGTLVQTTTGENRHYPWSADNSVEVERGWIKVANTIAELAAIMNLSVEQLEREVTLFNQHCIDGTTDQLGRDADHMRPISEPPFYGVSVEPTLINTQGGPRRNARGQILRPDGSPISGLYGAGELGSVWSRLYPGAGNVSECLVSGRLAAKSALG